MEILAPSVSLIEKLQLKDERNLLIQGLPSTIEKQFVKFSFSKNVTPLLKVKKIDFALVFAINHNQLKDILKEVVPALGENAKLWISYPKVSSKIVSDLSRDCNWPCITTWGLECVRSVALDNVWCAMQFKKNENKRSYHNVDVSGINLETREIIPPVELQHRFAKNKKANAFFEALPLTNQKEYIVWINSAKKEETKLARLETAIERLNTGKRNPSDK